MHRGLPPHFALRGAPERRRAAAALAESGAAAEHLGDIPRHAARVARVAHREAGAR